MPDSRIDFSDIPESTDAELKRARRVGRPKTGSAKQLIAIRISPRLLAQLRRLAARQSKPYQTLIHELLERATKLKDGAYVFGFPEEWVAFQQHHARFLESFETLAETMNKVRVRTFTPRSPADETVFFLGSLVFEDFTEVWLMAGNGLGTGALKVLRGMYERAVAAAYISRFPDEAKRFWKYGAIALRKVLNHAKVLYGLPYLESVLGADHMKEVEREYQKVHDDFKETLCKRCNLTRDMISWSKLGVPDMAKKAGYGLEHCYYNGYAIPTQQQHSTVLAVTSRLKLQADGRFFDNSLQKVYAALAVRTAHLVVLKMLRVENVYFALGLDSEIRQREAECKAAWPGIENECGKGL
jgi:uncharacterized protein (DUF4415 family)